MRRLAFAGLAALATAACQELVEPTQPTADLPRTIQLSVVVFGTTDIGVPLGGTNGFAEAINDLGEVIGISDRLGGQSGFRWINGTVQELNSGLGGDTRATDVDAEGNAVGCVIPALSAPLAMWWTANGGPNGQALASIQVGPTTVIEVQCATALNDRGEIVGTARIRNDLGVVQVLGLYWANKDVSAPVILTDLGGRLTEARDINNLGQIVGQSEDASEEIRPVFWSSHVATPLPLLSLAGGGNTGTAEGINDLGQMAGRGSLANGTDRAAVWHGPNSVPEDLGSLGGPNRARDINELGQIVGFARGDPQHAVLWEPGPFGYVLRDLGTFDGDPASDATGLNNTGLVVGWSGLNALSQRAAMWQVPIQVQLDVTPSPIRLDGKGRVTAVILTSRYFNAANVDPETLTLGNDDGLETPIARKRKLIPAATLVDLDRDGDADLVVEFAEGPLMANGDLSPASTQLTLLGRLRDGKHIRGSDAVLVQ